MFTFTTDRGANVVKCVKDELRWPHFGCFAHFLHNLVTSGLKNKFVADLI